MPRRSGDRPLARRDGKLKIRDVQGQSCLAVTAMKLPTGDAARTGRRKPPARSAYLCKDSVRKIYQAATPESFTAQMLRRKYNTDLTGKKIK